MSAIKEAIDDLKEFHTQVKVYLDTVASAASGSWAAAKPQDVEQKAATVRDAENKLKKSLEAVKDHQKKEQQLKTLREQLDAKTAAIRNIAAVLETNEVSIEQELARLEKFSTKPSTATENQAEFADVNSILQMARKLGYITHAPPGWHYKQGRPLPDRFRAPAPQMDHMKKGRLFKQPDKIVATLLKQEQEKAQDDSKSNRNGSSIEKDGSQEDDVEWEEEETTLQDPTGHVAKRMKIEND